MVVLNLFPGGVLQFFDVLKNGYWHARGPEFLNARVTILIEWMRLPADGVFILFGVVPLVISGGLTYRFVRR
jgi:nitric oxide reductase subunit B